MKARSKKMMDTRKENRGHQWKNKGMSMKSKQKETREGANKEGHEVGGRGVGSKNMRTLRRGRCNGPIEVGTLIAHTGRNGHREKAPFWNPRKVLQPVKKQPSLLISPVTIIFALTWVEEAIVVRIWVALTLLPRFPLSWRSPTVTNQIRTKNTTTTALQVDGNGPRDRVASTCTQK